MTEEPLIGTVRNGARLPVQFPWYAGIAGVQQTAEGWRVVYIGRAVAKAPASGTIDGRAVKVITAERSQTVESMTVLTVEFVEGAS